MMMRKNDLERIQLVRNKIFIINYYMHHHGIKIEKETNNFYVIDKSLFFGNEFTLGGKFIMSCLFHTCRIMCIIISNDI